MYNASPQNDIDIGRFSFDVYQPILIIFGVNVFERIWYQLHV